MTASSGGASGANLTVPSSASGTGKNASMLSVARAFLIYCTMTGLVFGKVFFSGSDPLIDTLKAFGVFFIGFVARPVGAAIFGHSTYRRCRRMKRS